MRPWRNVLGLGPGNTRQTARTQYLKRARQLHPNKGGNTAAFQELQRAWNDAQTYFNGPSSPPTPETSSPRQQPQPRPQPRRPASAPRTRSSGRRRPNAPRYTPAPLPNPRVASDTISNLFSTLRQGQVAATFDALPNVNRASLKKGFEAWAQRARLTPRTRQALYGALDVKSKTDLMDHINSVYAWIKSNIGRKKFAVVVDIGIKPSGAMSPGTSFLFAGPLVRVLGRMPDAIVPVTNGTWVDSHYLYKALDSGIRDFVYVDDAMITGRQKFAAAQSIGAYVNIKDMNDLMSGRPGPRIGDVTLWIGTAYATQQAADLVVSARKAYSQRDFVVKLVVPGRLAPVPRMSVGARFETWRRLQKGNRPIGPLLVFPHAVSNRAALGASLTAALTRSMPHAWPHTHRHVPI